MSILDISASGAFETQALTEGVNKMQSTYYDRLSSLFSPEPIRNTGFVVEVMDNSLYILPSRDRGDSPTNIEGTKRGASYFETLHLPEVSTITPQDLQNIRRFNSEIELKDLMGEIEQREKKMMGHIDSTIAMMRARAIAGYVTSYNDAGTAADNYNLFTKFGITEKTVDFVLGTTTTDVFSKVTTVVNHMRDKAKGENIQAIAGFCNPDFWNALIGHANVSKYYENWMASDVVINADGILQNGFPFGGAIFYNCNDNWVAPDKSTSVVFTASKTCRFVPLGTQNVFKDVYAPANMMEYVNTLGRKYYSSLDELPHGQGLSLRLESNPLCICKRPDLLVKGYYS